MRMEWPRESAVLVCNTCGEVAAYCCAGCGVALYCSARCQIRDWSNSHYSVCPGGETELSTIAGKLTESVQFSLEELLDGRVEIRNPRTKKPFAFTMFASLLRKTSADFQFKFFDGIATVPGAETQDAYLVVFMFQDFAIENFPMASRKYSDAVNFINRLKTIGSNSSDTALKSNNLNAIEAVLTHTVLQSDLLEASGKTSNDIKDAISKKRGGRVIIDILKADKGVRLATRKDLKVSGFSKKKQAIQFYVPRKVRYFKEDVLFGVDREFIAIRRETDVFSRDTDTDLERSDDMAEILATLIVSPPEKNSFLLVVLDIPLDIMLSGGTETLQRERRNSGVFFV